MTEIDEVMDVRKGAEQMVNSISRNKSHRMSRLGGSYC